MQRSSSRLKKQTPNAAVLKTPPRTNAPSPKATPTKRQPNSHAACATLNKKPRQGLQHFKLKRKSDNKKKPRVARELLEPEPEPEEGSERESSGDEQEETSDDEDVEEADDGQATDGDDADETDSEAAEAADESEESDDEEESDDLVIEVPQQPKPKSKPSKAQLYTQRPEREQTFLEFMATVSDDESDDTSDSDGELAEQVEAPEVDAEQGPTIISLSIDMYTSKNTGLHNSTVVIDQKRPDPNQRFIVDARNIIGMTKWNRGTVSYDTIHHLKVNNLLISVNFGSRTREFLTKHTASRNNGQ